ncbi:hypothetical protein [Nocardia aurantia]|uniref:Uncharacterized protein n=1 Tax=Nocardia aurantia TaxID=2585199 RepID=A0A7K0DTV2_9NOCA|nr:hypothetical protein [Nocardia aurantia]MQY29195.1 hypothetical protein [Nocardia aurantia]
MSEPHAEHPAGDAPVGVAPTGSIPGPGLATAGEAGADGDLLQESLVAADLLSDAIGSMRGRLVGSGGIVRANNIILGDATVGTLVGRDHLAGAPGRRIVPSGAVSTGLLAQLAGTFAAPAVFEQMCHRLRTESLVLLRAPSGWGRTATALRALDRESGAGVHKLNPDVQLRSLDIELTPDLGYLLESSGAAQMLRSSSYHLEQLSHTLAARDCRMVVVLDDTTELPAEIGRFVLDGGEPADAIRVVGAHLHEESTELLSDPAVRQLLAGMAQIRPPARALVLLAAELAEVSAGRAVLADVVERHSAADDDRFRDWFDNELDTETRAFVIAVAVFHRMPLNFVSAAGRTLHEFVGHAEEPDEKKRSRSIFGSPISRLLDSARAESFTADEETDYGRIPARAVRFLDERYPERVLDYVWREYHAAHHPIREWLREFGGSPDLAVCAHAGVAVGLLSASEFERARELLIEPWALSGNRHERFAAIGALQLPCLRPELAPPILNMIRAWMGRDQPLPLRTAATEALGTAIGQTMPDRSITLLRRAARSTEASLRQAASYSLVQLFWSPGLTERALRELESWTRSDKYLLRDTGFRCTLDLSRYKGIDTPHSTATWPLPVWLAEATAHRETVVTLFARLLTAPVHMPAAYDEIRRWVGIAERDHGLCGPLGSLLIDLGTAIDDPETLPYHLSAWADEPRGPRRAVAELLETIAAKEKSA